MAKNDDKAAKKRAKAIEKARKRQAKAARAARKGKHRHDDHGRTYTGHKWGKLYLFTTCSKCGKVVAKDKLEK